MQLQLANFQEFIFQQLQFSDFYELILYKFSARRYIFSKENTLNSKEWPNLENPLNVMAQVFPLLTESMISQKR